MAGPDGDPVYFASPDEFHAWLERNHDKAADVWVAIHKKGSERSGITLAEAQDQALRFGWVDSLARKVDDDAYKLRFTPRRPTANWTDANIARAEELIAAGEMHEAGVRAFEARKR
jgi:uncharacterized protein YdeI (YjbR/CyaY-like superfamily)